MLEKKPIEPLFPLFFPQIDEGMNSFVRCVACLALLACAVHAARRYVSDDVAASYKDAFEVYQINFDKHYDTKEEYNRRLRAYAVC